MVRPELHHANSRAADALSRPPARPHFDAVAWKQQQKRMELDAARNVAALLSKLEQARPARQSAAA